MLKTLGRIFIIIIVSFIFTVSYNSLSYAFEMDTIYYGDLNHDNQINAKDAYIVLLHSARVTILDDDEFIKADVTNDDNINSIDALDILKYSAGIISSFLVESELTATNEPEIVITPIPTMIPTEVPEFIPTVNGDVEMPEDFSGTVWILGDSIAAKHEKTASVRPLYGWGELIGEYFSDEVIFRNHAISSQSTSSYYSLYRSTYEYVFYYMKENDYVIISFGHNDHNKADLNGFDRTTDPEADTNVEKSYKWWLKNYYIDPILKKGAVPVLMSSIVRCTFENNKFFEADIHMKYGKAMEELVEEYAANGIKIYYIDAQDYTYNLYSSLTREEAMLYHGKYGYEASNYFDSTHLSEKGARLIIDYMIDEFKKNNLSIMEFYK